jgi:hypothetical protein
MPAVARATAANCGRYGARSLVALNGKPVPTSARAGSVTDDTVIGSGAASGVTRRRAPPPRVALNTSPVAALCTTPATSAPACVAPIDTAYHGKPWRKLVVPSSGSTTKASASPREAAGSYDSSPTNTASGWAVRRAARRISSAPRSTRLTKSAGPLCSQVSAPRRDAWAAMNAAASAAAARMVASSAASAVASGSGAGTARGGVTRRVGGGEGGGYVLRPWHRSTAASSRRASCTSATTSAP